MGIFKNTWSLDKINISVILIQTMYKIIITPLSDDGEHDTVYIIFELDYN